MQGIPAADIVSAFQASLDHCEKIILRSSVLKCFDKELNDVSNTYSPMTPLMDIVGDGHHGKRPLGIREQCTTTGCCQTEDNIQFTTCCENKPSYSVKSDENKSSCSVKSDENKSSYSVKSDENKSSCSVKSDENKSLYSVKSKCQANLHSLAVKQCRVKAGNWRQSTPPMCGMPSSSAESRMDAVNLDDDVRWFFEDASDAGGNSDHGTAREALELPYPLVKTTDVDLQSDSNKHKIMLQIRDAMPFLIDVDGYMLPASDALDKCNKEDKFDTSGRCISEFLFTDSRQRFSKCLASNADNSAPVSSQSEHSMQNFLNDALNPDSHRLLPAPKLQATGKELVDKESTAPLPQVGPSTMPEELQSSFTSDPRNLEKLSSNNKVSKHRLHSSRMLSRSRHFRSIQNAACNLRETEVDMSDKNMSDDMRDCDFQSDAVSLSALSQELKNAEASENKHLSEVGQSCVLQHQSCVLEQTGETVVTGARERTRDREFSYFKRLEMIGQCLSHRDDGMMRLAVEICHHQLALNPAQSWFVIF